MPSYQSSPFSAPLPMLIPGFVGFSFGKQAAHIPSTRMAVTSVAITTNVATLGVTLLEGLAPVVAQLVSVQGTQTPTSGGAPNFNVTNISIASVSGFNTGNNDTGTITFALTSSNIATTTDAGTALAPVPITGDAAATGNKGQQFGIQSHCAGNKQHGLSWFTQYTGSPSAVTLSLEIADVDVDSEYTIIDQSVVTAGETRSVGNITANFVRVVQTLITGGTSPKAAAGIILS